MPAPAITVARAGIVGTWRRRRRRRKKKKKKKRSKDVTMDLPKAVLRIQTDSVLYSTSTHFRLHLTL